MLKRKFLEEKSAFSNTTEIIESLTQHYQKEADRNRLKPNPLNSFETNKIPNIKFNDYLNRIVKYGVADSGEVESDAANLLIMMTIYIERFAQAKRYHINNKNIYRLSLTSFLLSQKYHCDYFHSNTEIAKIGGIPLEELNQLEREFLTAIDYKLYISNEVYQEFKRLIMNEAIIPTAGVKIRKMR